MIVFNQNNIAYGEEDGSWWNSFVASADNDWFDWQDVFSPMGPSEKGKNLYNLVFNKLNRSATRDARKEVAQKYGLTIDEMQASLDGSLIPIFNNKDRSSAQLTQEDAAKILANLQKDFNYLSELFQIQQEVEVSITPSEMFSNGNVNDSGFDLVHDLTIIEEILAHQNTPVSVGGVYEDAYPQPYNPTEEDQTFADFVAGGYASAELPLTIEDVDKKDDAGGGGKVGVIKVGDKKVEAEVLSQDVCPEDDLLGQALKDYEKKKGKDDKGSGGGDGDKEAGGGGEAAGGGSGDSDVDGGGNDGEGAEDAGATEAGASIKAAPKDLWKHPWCIGFQEDEIAVSGIHAGGFKSVGGVDSVPLYSSAEGNPDNQAISAKIGVCFDLKLVKETVSTYQPGDSCIICEVEKINAYLEKTLSHSLIPNKATGNLMESAKCKESGTLFNMQFITIWNPVPTPQNDDLIFGKNIFEQWNEFAENYQPIIFKNLSFKIEGKESDSADENLSWQTQSAPTGTTQVQLFDQIKRIRNANAAKAELGVQKFTTGNDISNIMLYSKDIFAEIQQMNFLFKNFKDTYIKIDKDALQELTNKPNVE